MLGQSELTVLVDPHLPSKIFQGITTELTGEGGSAAPLNDAIVKADKVDYDHLKLTPDWRTYAQYFARLEKQGLGINMAHLRRRDPGAPDGARRRRQAAGARRSWSG